MSDKAETVYFCDGKACSEDKKQHCYTQGHSCYRTPDVNHAISRIDPSFPPTRIVYNCVFNMLIECFKYEKDDDYFKDIARKIRKEKNMVTGQDICDMIIKHRLSNLELDPWGSDEYELWFIVKKATDEDKKYIVKVLNIRTGEVRTIVDQID